MKNNIKILNWFKENMKYIVLFAFFEIVLLIIPFGTKIASYDEQGGFLKFKEYVLRSLEDTMTIKNIFWFAPAVALALMEFSYLFSEKKVNFYHSLPLTRKKLYITNFLSGFFIFLISQIIIYLLIFVVLTNHIGFGNYLLEYTIKVFLANVITFIVMYSVCIFVMMITGNMIIAILGIFVVSIYFPLLALCKPTFESVIGYTPFYFISEGFNMVKQLGRFYREQFDNFDIPRFNYIMFYLNATITSIIFILSSLKLYQLRDLEKANETIVFDVAKKIIRVMLSVMFGIIIHSITSYGDKDIYSMVLIVIFTLFGHAILEMIIDKDLKSFKNDIVEKVIAMIIALVVVQVR